jgi:hypothetical protein
MARNKCAWTRFMDMHSGGGQKEKGMKYFLEGE